VRRGARQDTPAWSLVARRSSAKERHRLGVALVHIIIVGVANTKEENAAGVATSR